MPCKKLLLLSVICYLLSVITIPAFAETPTPTGIPTCDLCGWCPPEPTLNPTKPANWDQCYSCLYDATGQEQRGNYYTVLGCLSTKPEFFVQSILSVVFGIAGGIAFLAVLGGSAMVLTSAGDPEKLQNGKEMIISSLLGILLIVFSVFLVRFIGFDIFRLPGFGG
ncbi:hypothetical protein HY945_02805 [Candidatus Gottesmanbacteria bacterium]|nr:hypothetical protein [Candidatus Gottesmanbacteria bacterium]